MNDFRTVIDIPKGEKELGYDSKIMFMGSCFSENVGSRLAYYKLPVDVNPFGIVYNPVSVANSIRMLIDGKEFQEDDLNFSHDQWFSFFHHSRFSNSNLEECLQNINDRVTFSTQYLKEADFLFVTFGSSWVYELISQGAIVSNCHKLPAREFNRYRLEVDEIVKLYKELLVSLFVFNPKLQVVFTVSPIRHWKDGAHGNQLSKATLLLAVEQLAELFDRVSYFPSYEIVMDELRDYRFYQEDMLHISDAAVNYIWQRFKDVYLASGAHRVMGEVEKVVRAAAHRPFNIQSEEHQKFLRKYLQILNNLERNHPLMDFEKEKTIFLENLCQ